MTEWETEEFFKEIEEQDEREIIRSHMVWLEENGYSKTFIQARRMQLMATPGITIQGILDRGEL